MTAAKGNYRLPEILSTHESEILSQWIAEQVAGNTRPDLMDEAKLRPQSRTLLAEIATAARSGFLADISRPEWTGARAILEEISRTRAEQGFTPGETASYVLSLRGVLIDRLQEAYGNDISGLATEMRAANSMLDKLAQITADTSLRARESTIKQQQEEMLELSTPVVRLFHGILCVPLIGTLDSARTQVVMENLLQRIVETGSTIAIIDITGVPTVDTLVAQHLLKTIAATRLMGADCIVSGIRPQIAQTIVHLGVELQDVTTKATLADALAVALQRLGYTVQKSKKENGKEA